MAAPGYVRDIQELLEAFVQGDVHTLSHFREIWRSRNFTFIHEGKPKTIDRRTYTQVLFSTALGFLNEDQPLPLRLGALFALFYLYRTQPARPPTLIYLAEENVKQLYELTLNIKEHRLADAFLVMNTMSKSNTFIIGGTASNASSAVDKAKQLAEQSQLKKEKAREVLLGASSVKAYFNHPIVDKLNLADLDRNSAEYAEARKAVMGGRAGPSPAAMGEMVREKLEEYERRKAEQLTPRLPAASEPRGAAEPT